MHVPVELRPRASVDRGGGGAGCRTTTPPQVVVVKNSGKDHPTAPIFCFRPTIHTDVLPCLAPTYIAQPDHPNGACGGDEQWQNATEHTGNIMKWRRRRREN
eukprot:gene12725-biopygen14043